MRSAVRELVCEKDIKSYLVCARALETSQCDVKLYLA